MIELFLLFLLVISSSTTLVSAQCTEASLLQFSATPPSQFNAINSDISRCSNFPGVVICSATVAAITDNDVGPLSVDLSSVADVQRFFTWPGQANIDFLLNGTTELASLELYFLNYPSERIGLPEIELFRLATANDLSGTRINYVFDFDDVPSSTDNMRRKVTLGILENQNLGNIQFLRVTFSFSGVSGIDWFFLSEINLCSVTTDVIQFTTSQPNIVELSPSNPTSSVQLRCSVSPPGMFEWQWRQGGNVLGGGRNQTSTTDGTRTGILDIAGLRSSDEGTYTCRVNHQGQSSAEQQDVTLVLPVAVTADPTVFARPGGSVQLTCEVFGYLRPGQSHPSWSRNETGTPIQNGGRFTITLQSGSRPSQSSAGSSTVGLVTVLTIDQLNDGDTGNYFCSAEGATTPVMTALEVTLNPPPSPVTTSPGTTSPGTTSPGTTSPGTTSPGTTSPGTTPPGSTPEKQCNCQGVETQTLIACTVTIVLIVSISVATHVTICLYQYKHFRQTTPAKDEAVYEKVPEPVGGLADIEMKGNEAYVITTAVPVQK